MRVGICAIIKDCPDHYLQEWFNWHRLIGIDHFFIYDNDSSVPIKDAEDITVIPWKGKIQQLPAYNDCIQKHKDFDWIAFIDDDEFIVVESGSIKTLLLKHRESGLGLNWLIYGPEDPTKSNEPQLKKYTKHIPTTNESSKHIKSIVCPAKVKNFENPHYANFKIGNCTDVKNRIVTGAFTETCTASVAWINHYYCRSEKEFAQKIKKGRTDSTTPYTMSLYESVKNNATVESRRIIEIYDKLKYPKVICMRNVEAEQILISLIAEINKTQDTSKMTMIEIGSYCGESTIIFARYFKKVISIDPFMDNYDKNDPTCREAGFPVVLKKYLENTKPYTNIHLIKKTSDEAVSMFDKESIDFIYIDGCHTYEQVKKDIQNYTPILKKGSFITGHDYGLKQIPGVTKAVDEMLGKPIKVYTEGSWVHKNRKPIVLITPTGGRQKQFELCQKFMLSQNYVGKVVWIIVDDCVPVTSTIIHKFPDYWEVIQVHPTPSWKEGMNTQARNLQAGIDKAKGIDCEAIFIIEDDDYYSPKYLSVMTTAINDFDMVGESESLYYNVQIQAGHRNQNHNHSSLFQTAFKPKLIPVFEEVLKTKVKFIDIDFYKAVQNVQYLRGLDLAIGIKGQPGRAGIGMGHNPKYYRTRHDNMTPYQKQLLKTIYQ